MANPKGCYRGHGKYKPELCDLIPDLYKGGKSDAEVAVALDVSKDTYYKWIKQYPEFGDAVKKGKTISENWWQDIGRKACEGKIVTNARIYIANMKNRFGWTESLQIESHPAIQKTIAELKESIAAIKSHEKDF